MQLLALGGESQRNQEWIHAVGDEFKPLFDKVVVQDYAHWASGEPHIDIGRELDVAARAVRSLDNYVIFAKSAGSVLSLKGIAEGRLRPRACLFAGLPLGMIRRLETDGWWQFSMPVIIVQNTDDPVSPFREVEAYLRARLQAKSCKLIELPGDTHHYADTQKLKTLLSGLL